MNFRMVDRILDWEPYRTIHGVKVVSVEESQLRRRLGEPPTLPESLILESLFQLVNWLVILSTDYAQMGLGTQLDEARFLAPLAPKRRLSMEIVVHGWRDDGIWVDGSVSDGRQTVVVARRCLAMLVPLSDYHDPDELRTLYGRLCCADTD